MSSAALSLALFGLCALVFVIGLGLGALLDRNTWMRDCRRQAYRNWLRTDCKWSGHRGQFQDSHGYIGRDCR